MKLLRLVVVLLPWKLRRLVLVRAFGYELDPTSYIGVSWVYPGKVLRMGPHSFIGHGTVIRGLDEAHLGSYSQVGAFNWITGRSTDGSTEYFAADVDRRSAFQLGDHTTITARHYVDCSDAVEIGAFSTVAGLRSMLLTHQIDVTLGRQVARKIVIGDYCLVGAGCTFLPGATVPSYSVIGAGSVVRGELIEERHLYAGVPARGIRQLSGDLPYFVRRRGIVE